MSKYKIVIADSVDRQSWQNYVDEHEYGTIFHTPYMYDVYAATPHYVPFAMFATDENKNILAMLSGFIQTVKSGLLANFSSRAVLNHAPIYSSLEALSMLLISYKDFARDKAVYTEIRNHYIDPEYVKACESLNFEWEGHYNIVQKLPDSEATLWKQMSKKRKGGINKANRQEFEFCCDSSPSIVSAFFGLLSKQYAMLKLPIPEKEFFANCQKLDSSGHCKFFNMIEDGNIRISELTFIHKDTIYLVYIGIDQDVDFLNKRPVDLFHYETMKWCLENNIGNFDWMGAGKPNEEYGVRDFKLQYGGELTDYGRFKFFHSSLKYKIAEKGFKLLQKMSKTI
ncbi:MAG: GNAT family N-acetyltransferase [Candidatus Cloacimonetes bacterium]|nr:GNAT family N-acetyltransferase [Candidatus Cloacimonadota bacterium]